MFENVLYQEATNFLKSDIEQGKLPQALLFAGPPCSGKLTAAFEIARILSCTANPRGEWQCTCPSCIKHKNLVSTDLLIVGTRSCTPEISASRKTFLAALDKQENRLLTARYLFIRSVRKLTNRFSQAVWEGDDKISKITPLVSLIDELTEEIDPGRPLPEKPELEKLTLKLEEQCIKLENSFMYDSIPVAHIRKASAWAHYTLNTGKRVFIIENADSMQESVRNALLKTLEEPPEQSVFILTAQNRNAVMPTILSRVRTYAFKNRNFEQNMEVLTRIYHPNEEDIAKLTQHSVAQGMSVLSAYLNSFLPVSPEVIIREARTFMEHLNKNTLPDTESLLTQLKNFEPRIILKLFFNALFDICREKIICDDTTSVAYNTQKAERIAMAVKHAYTNITVYNQSPVAAIEKFTVFVLEG
ncbi:MAG: DNA polymerase III [Spirochaetales bacterium]